MTSLPAARTANAAFSATYRSTAVVVGGTSGIGAGLVKALARATKGNIHILIVGRNQASAENIIASLPKTSESQYEFIQSDVTLIKNVISASAGIKSRIKTLNYLVLSQGVIDMKGYVPTSEGIDEKFSLAFYSRWKFVDELMPCLEKAKEEGQEARVETIWAAGKGGPLQTALLDAKKLAIPSQEAREQGATCHDTMCVEYANRHPTMAFIHTYPGWVNTGIGGNLPFGLRQIFNVYLALRGTSSEDAGEWMTYPLLSPDFKQGPHHLDENGVPLPASTLFVTDAGRATLVEHYTKVIDV